jgi:membrane associated rhomboid family serine protease
MDRVTSGLNSGPIDLPPGFDPAARGPLDRNTAIALLQRADDLMESSDPERALALYSRTVGMADRDISAAGLYGLGNALYRLDRDDEALRAWQSVTELGETPVTYRAWRQVAAALVRGGDLKGALDAYRQCERRAPREDRAEIASRLGWLSKETGNTRAAGRYFSRSRGDALPPFVTYGIMAVTVVISIAAMNGAGGGLGGLEGTLALDKIAVADGELYRLLSVVLVHDPTNLLHLFFNMYALWFAGILVERMYGSWLFLAFYALCGIAASVSSCVFGDVPLAVGASGSIFGLFGIVLVATRFHHPMLDQQSRAVASQIGILIIINLAIGFSGSLNVDNSAHVGGLLAGLWLGFLIPPSQVATLASLWHGAKGSGGASLGLLGPVLGVAALLAVIGIGIIVADDKWGKYIPAGGMHVPAPAATARAAEAMPSVLLRL